MLYDWNSESSLHYSPPWPHIDHTYSPRSLAQGLRRMLQVSWNIARLPGKFTLVPRRKNTCLKLNQLAIFSCSVSSRLSMSVDPQATRAHTNRLPHFLLKDVVIMVRECCASLFTWNYYCSIIVVTFDIMLSRLGHHATGTSFPNYMLESLA